MEKPDLKQVSLAGLGLISAGAVLGLALAAPAAPAPDPAAAPPSATQESGPDGRPAA